MKNPNHVTSTQIFQGLKVADFSWVGVGPITIKYLADHGATVIHVESATHPETLRLAPPFKDGVPGIDRSGFFANFNSSKYGFSLNLNNPKGQEIARSLILWSDVVAESYTPGVMKRWGLDYSNAKRIKPDLIYYSTCQMGQTGPQAAHPGYGTQMAALSGFYNLTGWPDRAPSSPYGAYTDFINFRFGICALVAAIDYKRRTGIGQQIDLSQFEGGLQFLSPMILDYTVNNKISNRSGNQSDHAPHAAFRCLGQDKWCVIDAETDTEWIALCQAMGNPTWSKEDRFSDPLARKVHEEELNQLINHWTSSFSADTIMRVVQSAGVPAGVVQTAEDLFSDPQLDHRGHFQYLEHPEIGLHSYDSHPHHLSKTPGRPRRPAPCIGEHNEFVLTEILGMSDEDMVNLIEQGVLE